MTVTVNGNRKTMIECLDKVAMLQRHRAIKEPIHYVNGEWQVVLTYISLCKPTYCVSCMGVGWVVSLSLKKLATCSYILIMV